VGRPPTGPQGVIAPPPPPAQQRPTTQPPRAAPAIAPLVPPVAGARPAPTLRPGTPTAGVLVPSAPPAAFAKQPSSVGIPAVKRPAAPPPPEEEDPPLLDAEVEPGGPQSEAPIPERGPIEALSAQQAKELKALADGIDALDYFQVLQITDQAGLSDIKKAFYRWSRCYHPDRFFHIKEGEAKEAINALYKRITEAYYFLRDDTKRKKYAADIKGPDRANKLRFTEASESEVKAEKKKEQEEQFGNTPKGREFFKLALAEIEKENWSAAERNLKSALMYESGNAKFKEKLDLVKQKVFEAARASGNTGFKIK
jgi:hypothetical protein